jgi:predicted nuclease of predicted toxin-antitoxin system
MLKFISYKQIPTEVVTILRESGYEVFYIASDDADATVVSVCEHANKDGYIVLTGDETFVKEALMDNRLESGLLQVAPNKLVALQLAELLMRTIQKNETNLPYCYHRLEGEQLVKVKSLGMA